MTLKLNGNVGYSLEFCKCRKHPRVMPMWALLIRRPAPSSKEGTP